MDNKITRDEHITSDQQRWVIIDGTGLLHRSYHAFKDTRGPDGHPTGVVYGTLLLINKILRALDKPDHAIVVFDHPSGSLYRKALYQDYKSQRQERAEEISKQEPWVRTFLTASGIPVVSMYGVESDDVMAAIAKKESHDKKIAIVSSDKDMAQIVGGNVFWFTIDKNERNGIKRMTSKAISEKFGVPPKQMRDFLALQGDASDNIPGIRGVGKKTASKILKEFSSIKNLYEQISNDTNGKNKLDNVIGKTISNRIWEELQDARTSFFETIIPLVELRADTDISKIDYKDRIAVNDQLMQNLRDEHNLPSWFGYFLDWQEVRATNNNIAKKTASSPIPNQEPTDQSVAKNINKPS